MFDIYVKSKKIEKIDDEDVMLILRIEDFSISKKYRKYAIFTKDMNKYSVKKKSRKNVKKLTKHKYFLKVKKGVWINTRTNESKNFDILKSKMNSKRNVTKENVPKKCFCHVYENSHYQCACCLDTCHAPNITNSNMRMDHKMDNIMHNLKRNDVKKEPIEEEVFYKLNK